MRTAGPDSPSMPRCSRPRPSSRRAPDRSPRHACSNARACRWIGSSPSAPASRTSRACRSYTAIASSSHVADLTPADLPTPPQDVLHRQLQDFLRRALEDGHGDRVPIGDQEGEAFDHQVEWMRIRRQRWESAHGATDLEQDARSAEMVRSDCGAPRGQVGPASEAEVERLEPSRSFKKHRSRLIAVAGHGGRVASQERGSRALEVVERAAFRRGQEPLRRLELAGLEARLRRGQRAPAWSAGSGVSAVARSRSAAAAARPPRLCARPAECSRSAATASSGPAAASARCQARRSAANSASLTSASASCTRRRSSSDAAP